MSEHYGDDPGQWARPAPQHNDGERCPRCDLPATPFPPNRCPHPCHNPSQHNDGERCMGTGNLDSTLRTHIPCPGCLDCQQHNDGERMAGWNTATKADLIDALQRMDRTCEDQRQALHQANLVEQGLRAELEGHVQDKLVWRSRADALAEAVREIADELQERRLEDALQIALSALSTPEEGKG